MKKTRYAASFHYNEISLIKITISKETTHNISVSDREVILSGSSQYFGDKRIEKNSLNLFETLVEAKDYLILQLMAANENHRNEIAKNDEALSKLDWIG